MKILAIRIKNLASLEGETVIDFTEEPLASAGVFAITGPIGAGKSTILDALCLALFGETPRYNTVEGKVEIRDVIGNSIQQGDVRGILRNGTSEGSAEVDFIGVDKQRYRSTWSVNRARNRVTGNLQPSNFKAKNLDTNIDIPGTKTEVLTSVEKLVGLNFEQFTRSVLLAQGDFSAFLKAKNDDRASLLEKLTGTDIYSDISKLVHKKHADQQTELKGLNIERGAIKTLTDEEVAALHGELKQLKETIKDQEKVVKDIEAEIKWHNDLTGLQKNHDSAKAEFVAADEVLKEAAPRERHLQKIMLVQPARPLVEGKKSIAALKKDREEKYNSIQVALQTLNDKYAQLQIILKNATDDFNKHEVIHKEAQPKLETARELDGKILSKAGLVKQAQDEVRAIMQDHSVHKEDIAGKLADAKKLEGVINEIITWKSNNIAKEKVARNQVLISTRLEGGEKLLKQEVDAASELKKASNDNQGKKKEQEGLNEGLGELRKKRQTAMEAYMIQQQELSGIHIEQLGLDKEALDKVVENLVHGEAAWRLQYAAIKEVEEIKKVLVDDGAKLKESESKFEAIGELLRTAKIEYETARNLLDRAKLAATENVENLRLQLMEGEPCPVCGSMEHPYVIHDPAQDAVLVELERAFSESEGNYLEYNRSHSALSTECDSLAKSITARELSLKGKAHSLEQLQANWEKLELSKSCNEVLAEDRQEWLIRQLQGKRSENLQLQMQIRDYGNRKIDLDNKKIVLDQQADTIREDQDKLNELGREVRSLEERIQTYQRQEKEAVDALASLKESLSEYFESDQWFESWRKDPGTFLTKIKKFAEEWNEKERMHDEAIPKLGVLNEGIRLKQEQMEGILQKLEGKKGELIGIEKEYNELSDARKKFWEGRPVTEVEESFKKEVENKRLTLEGIREDSNILNVDIAGKSAQKEQFEKDIHGFQGQLTTIDDKIGKWLHDYHIKHAEMMTVDELLSHLDVKPEWLECEQVALRDIGSKYTQAETKWREREGILNDHQALRVSERTLEDLNGTHATVKASMAGFREKLGGIEFQLKQDIENKESIGELLKVIEEKAKVVNNWAKLDDVIGSADGKKFRQIAQEYTLEILLKYANDHLKTLNNRYELQKAPGSLGLQVMDLDMGNEIRSVNSLSGGETFLVSLGLALGLASLSSNRMNVESLFIDEGFGTLDSKTLGIAMDALERLQNQGRKVGVITHVQEMQERIGVQIRVSKEQSGRSKVEIF